MTTRASPRWRAAVLGLAPLALVAGVLGGLLRAGAWPALADSATVGRAAALHAALMIGGFFGTVIGIERALALGGRWAYLAPVASGVAALALLAGAVPQGIALLALASLVFLAVSLAIVQRQRAAHTVLLVVAALAWAGGNLAWWAGSPAAAVHAAWFAFLVVTIAAERLEMTRLMRHRPGTRASLALLVLAMLAGAALSAADARLGGLVYGLALCAAGAWLVLFDIARRTVRTTGLPRYMAVALLAGYVWLMVAGLAWAAAAAGAGEWRDIALHGLGLGFIVSMVMAHAPVILPAVARLKLRFGPAFYAPLALLHLSLALRLAAVAIPGLQRPAVIGNALALLAFAGVVVASAAAQRRAR